MKMTHSSLEFLGSPIFRPGLETVLSSKIELVRMMCERLKFINLFIYSNDFGKFLHFTEISFLSN